MLIKHTSSVLIIAVATTLLITACGPAATAAPSLEIRIAVPDGFANDNLQKALDAAAHDLGQGIVFDIETYINSRGKCGGHLNPEMMSYDLYLLFSQSALYAFGHYQLEPIPDDLLNSVNPLDQVNQAFTNGSQVMAVGQATEPVLLVYNPDITGNLPAKISIDQVLKLAGTATPTGVPVRLAISADSSVGLAILETVMSDKVPQGHTLEDVVFQGQYMQLLIDAAPTLNQFYGDKNVYSPDNIVDDFTQSKVGMVLATSDFLAELGRKGYTNPIGVTHVPMLGIQGGSAHSLGWVVPQGRPYTKMVWDLIVKLQARSEIVQWALANGMFPANQTTIKLWLDNPDLSAGLMAIPPKDNGGVQELSEIAAEATPWHIPNYVNIDIYNNVFLPLGDTLLAKVANKEINVSAAL
jgi:hypothetical protein